MSQPVFSNGRVHVMSDKCSTCIFRPGNLMNLQPGVVKTMVEESVAEGGGITCHKTIHGQREQEATCRGFYDAHGSRVPALRLAAKWGIIAEVDE
jgi:hypothetical protein